ncbi:MAG: hypothetical protein HKO00_12655, partial [Flavobacteriaceae bacterium]|nr:hypothetical protein [Flavobacteriaceae bacterium]
MKNFILRMFNSFKKSKWYALGIFICFSFLCSTQTTFAQKVTLETSVQANFGVDADAYSGILSFSLLPPGTELGTDDWLLGPSGEGVIANPGAGDPVYDALFNGDNIGAEFRMSQLINYQPIPGGVKWLDAAFLRDTNTAGNNMDLTVFGSTSDKNFDNPTSWVIKEGDVPQKNDIIDAYAHIRRDGLPSLDLWAFGAASTRSPNGNNYIDFEFFRAEVTYDAGAEQLVTAGPDCGHTSYVFDPVTGDDIEQGDLIISTNYTNGGAEADIRIYAWIDSSSILGLVADGATITDDDFIAYNQLLARPFNFGDGDADNDGTVEFEFWPCDNDTANVWGYALITPNSPNPAITPLAAQDNTDGDVAAPPWKTISTNGGVTDVYVDPTFTEFGVNATQFGLDQSSVNGICSNVFGSVIVKSRSSTSFTAELKDLVGPFTLGDTPEYSVTIAKSGDLNCVVNEVTLTATALPPGAYTYEWFKDGILIVGEITDTLLVTMPGSYSVKATLPGGCTAESEPIAVLQNIIEPTVTATGGILECAVEQVQLMGTIGSTNPDADLTFEWTGPDSYSNTTELNPIVTVAGDYTLTVTDNNNGCDNFDIAVVSGDPDVEPPVITCPSDVNVQCSGDVPAPDINLVTATDNSGAPPTVIHVGDSSDGLTCPETITRTYRATDACGNSAECTQLIIINDTIDPVIVDLGDVVLDLCNQQWPDNFTTTWTDNCSVGGDIISDGGGAVVLNPDGCSQSRVYTFTVSDDCLNTDTSTLTVTRDYDETDPEIADIPDYQLATCNEDWPTKLDTTWTDNCSTGGDLESDGGVDDGESADGCIQYRLYTFTVTDDCGNSDTETTRVAREYDMTDPEIADIPDYQLATCNEDWPTVLSSSWTDNCSTGGAIDSDGGVDDGESADGCIQYRLYTFTVTDDCGNSDTETTRVAREYDMTDPEIADIPDYQLATCNEDWPTVLSS